jgi:hypothetical protein
MLGHSILHKSMLWRRESESKFTPDFGKLDVL